MTTKSTFSLAVLLAGSLCAGAALAGDKSTGNVGEHGKNPMAMVDTDKDGKVSAAEHSSHSQKMFTQVDANKDGKITAEEMDAAHAAMRKEHAGMKQEGMKHEGMGADQRGTKSADMIKQMDTDGDGTLTLAEHSAGAQQMFSKQDTNKDGTLTDEEMKAGHKEKRKMSARSEE